MNFEELKAIPRTETGKGVARKLRAKGLIPAVVYGPKTPTRPLTLDQKDLSRILKTEAGSNALIRLQVEGEPEDKCPVVMIKELQSDHIKDTHLHTDLIEIDMTAKIVVEIPVQITGESPGVEEGGVLDYLKREVQVECLPKDIPESITVDVSGLNIGDSLTLSEIQVGEGIEILGDLKEPVIAVAAPMKEEEVAVAEEEEEEEVEEGAAEEAAPTDAEGAEESDSSK